MTESPSPQPLQYRRLKFLTLLAVTVWLVLAIWQAPVVQPVSAKGSIRGVWMTNIGASLAYYSLRLDETLANLAQHRLNTLYPAVWNRGYTLYPSRVAQAAGGQRRDWATDLPLLPFDDILRSLTRQAHRQHLRLIPWFEYGLMIPASSSIAQAHPDWLTTNQAGETVSNPGHAYPLLPQPLKTLQLEITGENMAWLNPFHPEVQRFITDLIVETVERYPVDGIQLDDHFGLPTNFGYDSYTIQRYRNEHGGTAPPSDPDEAEWVSWRARQLTQLMAKIARAVKAANPAAIISISPNPPGFAYRRYLQDWPEWVSQGLVDEVIVQIYRQDLAVLESDLYNSGFYHLRNVLPVGIGLYTGPLTAAKPVKQLRQEVELVQAAGYHGVSFFSWETTFWLFKAGAAEQIKETFIHLFGSKSRSGLTF